jgi:hypothetical protein
MRIVQLAHKPGHAGHWSSEDQEMYYGAYAKGSPETTGTRVRVIRHYSTTMLVLALDADGRPNGEVLDWNTGHDSVSDQQGVNSILRDIGSSLRYHRNGGSDIREERFAWEVR